MDSYNPQKIDKKWQKRWQETEIYTTLDRIEGKKNFYNLVMFPYPSGDLHVGHWHNFIGGDVYARFKRMQGCNVLSPIGFDAFGLPAENAAIKKGIHPKIWTYQNIKRMKSQLGSLGGVYDWQREVVTCDPAYYKWTQWFFLQLYGAGLAYRKKVACNFCPSCKTVLANEQVVEGACERCDFQVEQKEIEQWLFKITDYAEDLLAGLEKLDWPENTKTMQKNWIGKSVGWSFKFEIKSEKNIRSNAPGRLIDVFTTRADTLFGCTYLVVAPEHPIIGELKANIKNWKFIEQYIEESKRKTEKDRISEMGKKTGVELKGTWAINPANGREIRIFVADYVLMHYGTGAIMAVPAHDSRDWDFAKKYNLPTVKVITGGKADEVYEGEGVLISSDRFVGMKSETARERIGQWLHKKGLAEKRACYRLRDWLISRQRYWGVPIPMVFCEKHGWQPVKEKDLPVLLPNIKDFRPTSMCASPLANAKGFMKTACPECGGPAIRETDTIDTFVCSSWYFLRYADPRNEKEFASKDKIKSWLPVNLYIGGAEHTVLHLLYARFFTKALKKIGLLDFSEPFLRLHHQGIILGPDGQKMSKSKGNVVDPDEQVRQYGTDSVRMYLCFMGPYNQGGPWNPKGIMGVYRFLNRAWGVFQKPEAQIKNQKIEKLLHQTVKKVTLDIENLRFNTAISALMILLNEMQKQDQLSKKETRIFLRLLAPFAPHLTEELWFRLGGENSIHCQDWPEYDPALIKEEKIQLIVQINGRVRDKLEVVSGISQKEAEDLTFTRENITKWLLGKNIKKVVFVPDKLINIVV